MLEEWSRALLVNGVQQPRPTRAAARVASGSPGGWPRSRPREGRTESAERVPGGLAMVSRGAQMCGVPAALTERPAITGRSVDAYRCEPTAIA
jgi:hypothetical protein